MALNEGFSYREQLGPRAAGRTLLAYLVGRYAHSDEAQWTQRLARGEVQLGGQRATGTEVLRAGQDLVWHRPPWNEPDVPLHYETLHEDPDVLAVLKPSGLPTMHGGGFLRHTLLSLVRDRHPRAVALHRLGRFTSGLVLFGLTPGAASALARDWRDGRVGKQYRALASGAAAKGAYEITTRIGPVPHPRLGSVFAASASGKAARSDARVLERRRDSTLFEVDIHTGRPHQIRIHLASIGHPLVGDPLYAAGGLPRAELPGLPGDGGYLLHAGRLVFTHPATGRTLELHAPAPPELWTAAERLYCSR